MEITVICPDLESEGVLQILLRQFKAQVRLTGERSAWQALSVELPAGRLKITRLSDTAEPVRFKQRKASLAEEVRSILDVEPVHANFLAGSCLAAPVCLDVAADPPLRQGDQRLHVVLAIAAAHQGFVHAGEAFYNGAGGLMLNAEGKVEALPDKDQIARFLRLPTWPAKKQELWPTKRQESSPAKKQEFHVDFDALKVKVVHYLRGPGQKLLSELGLPAAVTAVVWVFGLIVALVQLVSIVWFQLGLKTLQVLFTPGSFTHPGNKLVGQPELLTPVILAGIIKGPSGHALALGSFDPATQADFDLLARKASELGHLYTEGSNDPRDAETVALLKDDVYRPYRRRAVPAANSGGRDLTLFDVEISPNWEHLQTRSGIYYLFAAATPEDGGCIVQLPWNLVTAPTPSPGAVPFVPLGVGPNPANQGWAPYRRAGILAGVGAVFILGLIVAFNWFVNGLFEPRRWAPPVAEVAPPPAPAAPMAFKKWVFSRDDMGRSGYFVDLGERWEEWKEIKDQPGKHECFAVFSKTDQTPEYIELVKKTEKETVWVRLSKWAAETSRDRKRWRTVFAGRPE